MSSRRFLILILLGWLTGGAQLMPGQSVAPGEDRSASPAMIESWVGGRGGEGAGSVVPEPFPPRREGQIPPAGGGARAEGDLVVLLHGLGRTPVSMLPLARALEAEGYEVLNWGYSSFCCSIAELGKLLHEELQAHRTHAERNVHFVGHSLGNIIIRWLLTHENAPPGVGRVVMLAPPNQGSHDADRYAPHLAWLFRPLPELQTDSESTVRNLDTVDGVSIGVIAGRFDGKVSLPETMLAEAADHVLVPATHTFLMFRGDVHRLTIHFLRDGRFPAPEETAEAPARIRRGEIR